ncbi:receptor-like serine/threonine-protein kinase ALE2 isoform X2 [Cryptomeria japonica]|uniref:receptor-like serine/threonine-protein kinase ALE2 isoform X2 n=1 Tax=Cryptomeria japonica TaxID=3369 RepID=UPI0025ACA0F0|nr:receptor-like serine/threonine-protein kinase ALE2 isoform X2 [Cryptomeria japonica]
MRLKPRAVYPETAWTAMWQSFILKVGVLWLACSMLIYCGDCSHDMIRDAFEGDNILLNSPMKQHSEELFCFRNGNLDSCIGSAVSGEGQDLDQLLQAETLSDQQLFDKPSSSALLPTARVLLDSLSSYSQSSISTSHRNLASQQYLHHNTHLGRSTSVAASQLTYTSSESLLSKWAQHLFPSTNLPVDPMPPFSQSFQNPSQNFPIPERPYSERIVRRLADSPSSVIPFHDSQSLKLTSQRFDLQRKQYPGVPPPLHDQSSQLHLAVVHEQGPAPKVAFDMVDKPSVPSKQIPPVAVPISVSPYNQWRHRHHSTYLAPKQFNDPFPALPSAAHSKTLVSPAVHHARPPSSSVPYSARRKRSERHATVMPPTSQGPVAVSPRKAPSGHHPKKPKIPIAASPRIFLPPPTYQDCTKLTCVEPLTNTPPDAPCGCVLPMQVGILLGVAPYAIFPMVSELAAEIAAGIFLKQSQIRIMGANADPQDQERTHVSIDLVPLGERFDNMTAFLTYQRFWQKKVIINETLFGDYGVDFVHYPGLPPSPPSPFSNTTDGSNGKGSAISGGLNGEEPLGVDVRRKSEKMGGGVIAVVALSSAVAVVICLAAVWFILLKCSNQSKLPAAVPPTFVSSVPKRSGGGSILSSSIPSSTSFSFVSSMATYTGSARTFTLAELEKATDRFISKNILGEGGFGRVYRGVLEDGTKLAVKVLTRDDHQGGREFMAEVEMLSRLHHRNLVKLIGICTEERNRCLVYELIPNGSVESHLHGPDKETCPLDWDARMKIAIGAARGLAYLHEDSNPRVIHRDFKASNILLEDDFTPKVSDFGLAKVASDEGKEYISTRVMGTFGYVAPEYAMTGHLLVKSDVYSYGVVLLELLSGRKPVDMSQPPGQENLVTWARPLLTTKEGLEMLVDPALKGTYSFDNLARVAAIASMCVQPEVSHRPFMGEVVQALKLVYNDLDVSNKGGSQNSSQVEDSPSSQIELKEDSDHAWWPSTRYIPDATSFVTIDYDSGPLHAQGLDMERPLSASALLSSGCLMRESSDSFRRHSCSGPLRTNRSKPAWYRIRGLTRGSMSEHGLTRHFGTGLGTDVNEFWP